MVRHPRAGENWMLDVGRWMLGVVLICSLLGPLRLRAQAPPQIPPGGLIQLQVQQPSVDVTTASSATASFDPPVVRPGEKNFLPRDSGHDGSSIAWSENWTRPSELAIGPACAGKRANARQQFPADDHFLYPVRARTNGQFTRPAVHGRSYGKP